jgi:hypothetical protein
MRSSVGMAVAVRQALAARARALRLGLGVSMASVLCCAAVAHAEVTNTTTLDFDGFPAETFITNQYSGIVFERYLEAGFTYGAPGNGTFNNDCIPGPRVFATSLTHSGAQAADLGCGSDAYPDDGVLASLTNLAKEVSVYVGATQGPAQSFSLYAWNVEHQLVASQTISATQSGIANKLSLATASPEIAYLGIVGPAYPVVPHIVARARPALTFLATNYAMDDLSFTAPAVAPPDLAVVFNGTSTPLNVAQGQTSNIPVAIQRFNGSDGNVALSIAGLPAGVSAKIVPSTLSGTETKATIELSAEATASSEVTSATITATPETKAAGSVPRSITTPARALEAFSLTASGGGAVAPCTSYSYPIAVQSPALLTTQSVHLQASPGAGAPAGTIASVSPADVSAYNGHAIVTVTESSALTNGASFSIGVTGSLTGAPNRTVSISQLGYPGRVTSTAGGYATPSLSVLPASALNGPLFSSHFTILGEGFCPGSTVQFGNHLARAPSSTSASGSALTGTVPELATSGSLEVLTPQGAVLRAPTPVHIDSYRDTYGFDFPNQAVGAGPGFPKLTDDMLRRVYPGASLELPWGPGLTPEAILLEDVVNKSLQSGYCYGISLADLEFLEGIEATSSYPPGASLAPFALTGSGEPSVVLGETLAEDFSIQFSDEVIGQVTGQIIGNWLSTGPPPQAKEIQELLAQHTPPIIGMVPGLNGGHAVVAYASETLPNGNTAIDVYNSNVPYRSSEEEASSSSDNAEGHLSRERTNSQIVIEPDAHGHWSFAELGMTGDSSNLLVFPQSKTPLLDGHTPTTPNLFTIAGVDIAMGSTGERIVGGADASGNTSWDAASARFIPKSGRPDLVAWAPLGGIAGPPSLLTGPSSSASLSVSRHGSGDIDLLGHGLGAELRTGSRTGVDGLGWKPAAGELSLKSGSSSPISASLVASASGAGAAASAASQQEHLAEVSSGASRGGSDSWSFAGGRTLALTHRGAATVAHITLQAIGSGQTPYAVALPPIALASGARLSVHPASWRSLASTAIRVAIHTRHGTRVRTVHGHRLGRAFARVTGASFAQAKGATELHLKLRVGKLPAGASTTVAVTLHGRRTVRLKPVILDAAHLRAGTRTLTLALPSLAKGRYRVSTIVASDTGAGKLVRPAAPARFSSSASLR